MGNRLSKIYTRTGDDGSTGLGDGSRVGKDSLRVNAYGTVDELNSAIGMVLAADGVGDEVREALTQVQHDLFDLGGELCIPGMAIVAFVVSWTACYLLSNGSFYWLSASVPLPRSSAAWFANLGDWYLPFLQTTALYVAIGAVAHVLATQVSRALQAERTGLPR